MIHAESGGFEPPGPARVLRFFRDPEHSGRGEIRTRGDIAASPVFKTGTLNRSVTLPLCLGHSGAFPPKADQPRAGKTGAFLSAVGGRPLC